jgi:hypothetical protein
MPAPSTVSAQDINTEIGYSTTASVNLNETRARNLACRSSGVISYGDCRWGINFRGGSATLLSFDKDYATTNELSAFAFDAELAPYFAQASCELTFYANGQMRVVVSEAAFASSYNSTWLTSGSAGDYTVQVTVSSGSWDTGTTGSDLAMNSNRSWSMSVSTSGSYTAQDATGNIIIKDGGGTLITRPYYFLAAAEAII